MKKRVSLGFLSTNLLGLIWSHRLPDGIGY